MEIKITFCDFVTPPTPRDDSEAAQAEIDEKVIKLAEATQTEWMALSELHRRIRAGHFGKDVTVDYKTGESPASVGAEEYQYILYTITAKNFPDEILVAGLLQQ